MAGRPTIADVANQAGVSVATVDRVLNGRAPVREETAKRVYEAAHGIGYHAASIIKQRLQADFPEVRMGFVLQKEKQVFYRNLTAELTEAVRVAPGIRGSISIEYASSQSPGEVAALIESVAAKSQVVGAVAVNHHQISDVVQRLRRRNIPVFAMFSDFAQGVRESYVGLNNLSVGRVSAWMISKTARNKKIAIYVGGHRWHGHELRETGFRSFFRERAEQFQVLDTLVNLETRQLTYEATLDLLDRHPDLGGMYVAGGGMEGAISAVREVCQPEQLAVVVNELTPDTRAALQDNYLTMVNGTPLQPLCRDLVGLMANSVLSGMSETRGQHFLAQELFLPEGI